MTENSKPRVLITGAAGLIGSRLMQYLSSMATVVGMDVKQPECLFAGCDFIHCDLTDSESVTRALAEYRSRHGDTMESVVHLAAYYDFTGKPSSLYQELTVEGTRRLLRGLTSFHVEQFIFSSSMLVVVPAEDGERLTEDSPTDGDWDYPRSKLAAEEVIQAERGQIPVVILRIAGVYDEDGHSIPIAQHIRRIYEQTWESYFFPGDKEHGQAFVHLDDLMRCFASTIEHRHDLGHYQTLLVGEEDVMSYNDLQEQIGELVHGTAWPTIRIPKAVAKMGAWVQEQFAADDSETFIKPWMIDFADQDYHINTSKAREVLGWQPQKSLRRTLPEIIRRLKEHPQQWYETNGLQWSESVSQE